MSGFSIGKYTNYKKILAWGVRLTCLIAFPASVGLFILAPSLIKLSESASKNIESNYNNEEELLVEVNQDIRALITELEKKDNVKETQ